MLPKGIASCSFSGMILASHYYFQGQKGPIYWGFFSRSERSNLDLYCTYCSFIYSKSGMELLQDSANEMWTDIFYGNYKGHFQGQVWLIFTYFSLLISSIEMLAKYLARSFSNVRNDKMDDKNVQSSLCITSMKQKLSGPIEAHEPFIFIPDLIFLQQYFSWSKK